MNFIRRLLLRWLGAPSAEVNAAGTDTLRYTGAVAPPVYPGERVRQTEATTIIRVYQAIDGVVVEIADFNPHGEEKWRMYVQQPDESADDVVSRAFTLHRLTPKERQ
jgi:hypothetical protein